MGLWIVNHTSQLLVTFASDTLGIKSYNIDVKPQSKFASKITDRT